MVEALNPPNPLTKQQISYVRRCVDVIIDLCVLYGFDTTGFERKATYSHWEYCAAVMGNEVKFVKWKIACYYSFHNDQELPVSTVSFLDNPSCILSGRGYLFLKNLKHYDRSTFDGWVLSVLYSKKGMPKPDNNYLKVAEKEAFFKLTSPVAAKPAILLSWSTLTETGFTGSTTLSQSDVVSQIRRTCNEVFKDTSYTMADRIEPFFPSTSSNYFNTRSLGGVVGTILDSPSLLKGLKTEEELIQLTQKGHGRSSAVMVDDSKLRDNFTKLYMNMMDEAMKEIPLAKPKGLPEALKARVITQGPPLLYTVLKPLQHKLHSVMRKHPCFELIGTPVTSDFVQKRMGAVLRNVDDGFLSIDYADATNELYSWASEAAMHSIADLLDLTPEERQLSITALTQHVIEFEGEVALQRRGQLMGSIMSFPILCIVNAAVCRWAKEIEALRTFTLRDCPLAINGDDAILKTTKIGQNLQERISSFTGLRPSVGKVYFSRTFLNINSTTYQYYADGFETYSILNFNDQLVERKRHFELKKYVNLGLLFGITRSGGTSGTIVDTGYSIGARARDLINNSPLFMRDRLLKEFIHRNYELLSEARLPWFIPEYLGGFGLPTTDAYTSTNLDLRLARKIYEHSDVFKLSTKPLDTNWQTWRYATKRFPINPTLTLGGEFTALSKADSPTSAISYKTLLGLTCVEALFRSKGIAHLYKQVKNVKSSRGFYTSCHRIYKKALLDETIPLPEPFVQGSFPVVFDRSNLRSLYLVKDAVTEVHTYVSKVGVF